MRNKLIQAVPLVLCLLLAACATPQEEVTTAPTSTVKLVHTGSSIDDLLAYHQALRKMSPPELGRELQSLNGRTPGALVSVQKAMALCLTRDMADLARAQTLLSNVLADTGAQADSVKPLANLLAFNLAEIRRQADNAERSGQQARENQRKLDQLSEKLEALKNIERSMPLTPGK
ncbi:hypothetical protein PQR62_22445 [Herbaspirillum lusitanum]|jgi:hypothetical protein|uniref:Permease n=1 Tax=Herbaspirillum lusitanum TaxID=213312 RepID=A0ABW9AFM4_9BURK